MKRLHSQERTVRVESLGRIPLSFIFLCAFLAFAHPDLDDYVPGVKVTQATVSIGNPEKQSKRDLGNTIRAINSGDHSVFKPIFVFSFVKFDRTQNTPPWPFMTTGAARAPPAAFSL